MGKVFLYAIVTILSLCTNLMGALQYASLSTPSNCVYTVDVPAGQTMKLHYAMSSNGTAVVSVIVEGLNHTIYPDLDPNVSTWSPKVIPGPCSIKMEARERWISTGCGIDDRTLVQGIALFVFELISDPSPTQPATGVVIPSDGVGNVHVILESSADLVTWTEAEPGFYGRTESKRFFRLRLINGNE